MATAPSPIYSRKTGRVTIAQYMRLPDDGRKYEVFDGELVMSPSYNFGHGAAAGYVMSRLLPFVERRSLGVVGQETDVVMEKFISVVRPDICFITKSRVSIIRGHIYGPPDFVIEFTSPANRDYDLHEKRDLYERFGVREYWVFDIAENRDRAYQWTLKHGLFHGGMVRERKIASQVLKGFSLQLNRVWKAAQH